MPKLWDAQSLWVINSLDGRMTLSLDMLESIIKEVRES